MSYPVIYTDCCYVEVIIDPEDPEGCPVGIRDTRSSSEPNLWLKADEARELAESILTYLDQQSDEDLLAAAAENGDLVRFVYRKSADAAPELRTLRPSEVYESRAHDKLVLGYDEDRDDVRVFRLDRITAPSVVSA